MMFKILFVQKEGGIFGAENYQLKIIPELLSRGLKVDFLRLYTDYQGGSGGDFIDRLKGMGANTFEVNIGKYPSFGVLKSINNVVKAEDYDLVHTHLIHADFHLALIKTLFRAKHKVVSTKHGYDNNFTSKYGFNASKQKPTAYFLISRWAERRMLASYTISRGLRDFFVKTGLTTESKMRLIPYGFNMPDNYELRGEDEYRKAKKQLVIAGRLVAFKGHEYLINAMIEVVRVFGKDVKLLIAGSGEMEAKLKAQVTNLQLDENIVFLGYNKTVGALMANSDVVVIPSISEGFGVVFLEAFASKTPVVCWDVPAGNELIDHRENGYLVDPYDVDALAKQLIEILKAPEEQSAVVENAYHRLKSNYNLDTMVNETIKFYRQVIN